MANSDYRYLGTWRAGRRDWRVQALSVFSLAVAFVCLAAALLVVTNIAHVRDRWSRAGRATVYLHDGTNDQTATELVKALESTAGVSGAHYVPAAEARQEVVGQSGDSQLAALPAEAFPSSVELRFDDNVTNDKLTAMALKLRALPAVEMVETYDKWTERLSTLLQGGVTAGIFLALIVFAAVVSVVASTMRLLLERRRIEVEVLRIVGATTRFVRRPFVIEGGMQGGAGAALAVGILAVIYALVRSNFDGHLATMVGMRPTFLPWTMILGMITTGVVMGAVTAYVSLHKAVRS